MKAKLIAVTKPVVEGIEDAKDLIAYCARVSSPSNQMNMDTAEKLINYLIKYKHWSPAEMVNCVVEVEAPRDIARQLLRHRSFSFQEFCIAGDSKITMVHKSGGAYTKTIKELYELQNSEYATRANWGIRFYNENTKQLEVSKVVEVFNTGEKECFEVTLENNFNKDGKKVTGTADHKLFTLNGWKRIGDLTPDDFVAENGIPIYQDKDWLLSAKIACINNGTGLNGIADLANVSYHTIRKWLKIHSLQFTKQEVAAYTTIWNKGLATELQPMAGKFHSEESRERMRKSSKQGEDSSLYKTGNCTFENRPFRKDVTIWARGFLTELLQEQNYKCAITGVDIDKNSAEVDHVIPVYLRPDLAYEKSNLQLLSKKAHFEKTKKESLDSKLTIKYKKVASITPVGIIQTYDLEIESGSHNYVANGIITHNSQRYADVTALGDSFINRPARKQDTKNRQNSLEFDFTDEEERFICSEWLNKQNEILSLVEETYKWAIDSGIAKEVARVILPEGLTMSRLYVNGTIRSWVHYIEVRTEEGVTQLEHVELARLIAQAIAEAFPQITNFVKE